MDDPQAEIEAETEVKTESQLRSVLKTLSWRIVASTTTMVIGYLVTGSIGAAGALAGIEFFAKIPIYYFHERVWQCAPRGTIRKMFRGKSVDR